MTMAPAKKRKIADESQNGNPVDETTISKSHDTQPDGQESEPEPSRDSRMDPISVDRNEERKERFKALQARAVSLLRPTLHE